MTIKNKYAQAHLSAEEKKGTVAQMIRKGLQSGDWSGIADGYGELLQEFGKQTRIPKAEQKGGKDRTDTTPADSYNSQLQAISKAMADQGNKKVTSKLKAALIESDDGDQWGLVAVEGRKQSKKTTKKLDTIRTELVGLFDGRSFDEKVSELETIAKLMGIPFNRASVTKLTPNTKATKKVKGEDPVKTVTKAASKRSKAA